MGPLAFLFASLYLTGVFRNHMPDGQRAAVQKTIT